LEIRRIFQEGYSIPELGLNFQSSVESPCAQSFQIVVLAVSSTRRLFVLARACRVRTCVLVAAANVVIWTPGVTSGNPLSLNLLPDFAAIGGRQDTETEDERSQAVEMARATLAPYLPEGAAQARSPGRHAAGLRAKRRRLDPRPHQPIVRPA
jgi:hypothetical protein